MCLFVFFFKQKTAYEMRISDWSSDVCSSDLQEKRRLTAQPWPQGEAKEGGRAHDRHRGCQTHKKGSVDHRHKQRRPTWLSSCRMPIAGPECLYHDRGPDRDNFVFCANTRPNRRMCGIPMCGMRPVRQEGRRGGKGCVRTC